MSGCPRSSQERDPRGPQGRLKESDGISGKFQRVDKGILGAFTEISECLMSVSGCLTGAQ